MTKKMSAVRLNHATAGEEIHLRENGMGCGATVGATSAGREAVNAWESAARNCGVWRVARGRTALGETGAAAHA